MLEKKLRCIRCGNAYRLEQRYNCDKCLGILDVFFDLQNLPLHERQSLFKPVGQLKGVWKYWPLMPLQSMENIVSLDEGGTPLFPAERLPKAHFPGSIFLKDETRNPTGSFKDRATSVAISKAKENGCMAVMTASSGNAGCATAAYAALAGLPAVILVPERVAQTKLVQMSSYGANIFRVRGNYSRSFNLAKKVTAECSQIGNLTSTYLNPYATEGDKTVAYELYFQLNGDVPDWIFIPVGSGPLLTGIYKGYMELFNADLIKKLPRMVAVQSEGCAPIAKAFEEGKDTVDPWGHVSTIASGISDPLEGYSQDGSYTLQIVRKSHGFVIKVSDKAILDAVHLLGELQGVFAEPTGAVALAGIRQVSDRRIVSPKDLSVCLITGLGFKDLNPILEKMKLPSLIGDDFDDFQMLLRRLLQANARC